MQESVEQERRGDAVSAWLRETSVDGVSLETKQRLIEQITERLEAIRNYTPKVGVFGNSGVGKSSLCNALFGQEMAKVHDVEACTREPQVITVGLGEGSEKGIKLVDVPGIGEDPERQEEYVKLYKSLVPELDLVLWLIKADDRNYASAIDAFDEVFNTDRRTVLTDSGGQNAAPVIFVITQTDKTNDTDDWDRDSYAGRQSSWEYRY